MWIFCLASTCDTVRSTYISLVACWENSFRWNICTVPVSYLPYHILSILYSVLIFPKLYQLAFLFPPPSLLRLVFGTSTYFLYECLVGTGSTGTNLFSLTSRYGQESGAEGERLEILQQPLALGYLTSTAHTGTMPRWWVLFSYLLPIQVPYQYNLAIPESYSPDNDKVLFYQINLHWSSNFPGLGWKQLALELSQLLPCRTVTHFHGIKYPQFSIINVICHEVHL